MAVGLAQLLVIGVFCLGIYRIANGRLDKKVNRDTCHASMDGLKAIRKNDMEHIDQRFDALEVMIENGKEAS